MNMLEKTSKPAKIKLHWSRRRKKPYNHAKNFKPSSAIQDGFPSFEVSQRFSKNGGLFPTILSHPRTETTLLRMNLKLMMLIMM